MVAEAACRADAPRHFPRSGVQHAMQIGLLTSASLYFPLLPIPKDSGCGGDPGDPLRVSSAVHSCGAVADLHRLPNYLSA
jgi:hypothetical protein